jgi:hypothetical protein
MKTPVTSNCLASAASCSHTAIVIRPSERGNFIPRLRELAGLLADLAKDPADRLSRQRAVDHAHDIDRRLAASTAPAGTAPAAAVMVARMVIADVMLFAGVDTGELSPP